MGDPAGVGPELCLHLLLRSPASEPACPIIFGDAAILQEVARRTGLIFQAPIVPWEMWRTHPAPPDQPIVVDFHSLGPDQFQAGQISPAAGLAAYRYIQAAIESCIRGEVRAVTTCPIHKEALHAAGIPHPGHTEIFTALTKSPRTCMMLTSPELTCSFVTTHIGLAEVAARLSSERILEVITLTAAALQKIRPGQPDLSVLALNPHGGEHGLFGRREEEEVIQPAIKQARALGLKVNGPLPPDTAFLPERRKSTDAYICMYHDQGHIPLKMLAFDSAVNVTLGLPIVRTSVSHGTAFDIAWQGQANPSSLFHAIQMAARLAFVT